MELFGLIKIYLKPFIGYVTLWVGKYTEEKPRKFNGTSGTVILVSNFLTTK
jgi:hypothetical protein